MDAEQIARAALLDLATVRRTIALLGREPDLEDWDCEVTWVRRYPKPLC